MIVNIKDFYLIKNEPQLMIGHLRVSIPEKSLEILGVLAVNKGGRWFFRMPSKPGMHHVTGKKCHFPYVSFPKEEMQEFFKQIQEKGPKFIQNAFKSPETIKKVAMPPKGQRAKPASGGLKRRTAGDVSSLATSGWVTPKKLDSKFMSKRTYR